MIQAKNLKKLNKKYNVDFTKRFDGGVFNITSKKGFTKYIVAFNNDWYNSLIVHECVHLTNDILKGVRAGLDVNNDEPQAYLTQWLFEQCEEFLNEK